MPEPMQYFLGQKSPESKGILRRMTELMQSNLLGVVDEKGDGNG